MAKTGYLSANVDPSTDTFREWMNRTNQVIYDMGSVVFTVSTDAGGNVSLGGTTTGNGYINGILSANDLVAVTALRGGNNTATANLDISSNVHIGNSTVAVGVLTSTANVNFTGANIQFDTTTYTVNGNTILNDLLTVNDDIVASGNAELQSTANVNVLKVADRVDSDVTVGNTTTGYNVTLANTGTVNTYNLNIRNKIIENVTIQANTGYLAGTPSTHRGLTVYGNTVVHHHANVNTLGVESDATVSGNLAVTENSTFTNTVTIANTANIVGAANLASTLNVAGVTTLQSNVNVADSTEANVFNLVVRNNATFGVDATDTVTFNAVSGSFIPNANGIALGNTTHRWNVSATDGNFSADVQVSGNVDVTANLSVDGTATINSLAVSSNADVTGHASVGQTLTVTGVGTFQANLGVTGHLSVTETLGVTNSVNFSNTLIVTGATTLNNTLGAGNTTVTNLTATANVQFNQQATVSGNTILGSDTSDRVTFNALSNAIQPVANGTAFGNSTQQWAVTTGTLDTYGAAHLRGTLTVDGNVILGDAASDTVTFNADVTGSIIPTANGNDFGSATARWDVFANSINASNTMNVTGLVTLSGGINMSGGQSANVDILRVRSGANVEGNFDARGDVILGSNSSDSVTVNGLVGSVFPTANDTAFGNTTQRWDVFAVDVNVSNNISAATSNVSGTADVQGNVSLVSAEAGNIVGTTAFSHVVATANSTTANVDVSNGSITTEYNTTSSTNTVSRTVKIGDDSITITKTIDLDSFRISGIGISSGGTNYVVSDTITLTGDVSASQANAVVTANDSGGAITGIEMVTEGDGFTSGETISISTDGSGTGASFTYNRTNSNTITMVAGSNTDLTLAHLSVTNSVSLPSNTSLSFDVGTMQTLTVFGESDLQGNVVLGDTTSDIITFNGRTTGDIIPSSNVAYDLGSTARVFDQVHGERLWVHSAVQTGLMPQGNNTLSLGNTTNQWDNMYVQDGFVSNDLAVTNNLTVDGVTTLNGNMVLGSNSSDTVAFNGVLTTAIVPNSNNVHDLGSPTRMMGNTYVTNLFASDNVTGNYTAPSDPALKTDIMLIEDPLDIISKIRGYGFNWKQNGRPDYGVISSEIKEAMPRLVKEGGWVEKFDTVNYNGIIPLLIECIHALQDQVDKLKE